MIRVAALFLLAVSPLAQAAQHVVTIGPGFTYSPSQLQVEAGDTVLFSASGSHPLRSDGDTFSCNLSCEIAFPQPGQFGFYCANHGDPGGEGMSGLVQVLPSPRIHADGFED